MNNKLLSTRQATLWFILYQVGSGFILLPTALAKTAKQDAWLSVAFSIAVAILFIPLYTAIARQMNGKSFALYMKEMFGKWFGGLFVCVFIAIFPLIIFILTLRNLSDFITSAISPEANTTVISIIMIIAVYAAVRSGAAVIGRSAELLFFVLPVLYMIVTVTLLFTVNFKTLLPVFEFGWKPIVKSSFLLIAFPYMESVLFLFFVPHLAKTKKWGKVVLWSTVISGLIYFGAVLMTIATLSEGVASSAMYSAYFVVRTISIAGFVERFEIIVTVFWYITIFYRLCLLMYISTLGLAETMRLKESNMLIIPLLLIALASAHFILPNMTYLFEFFNIWPSYAMLFGIGLPAVIWTIGAIKKRVQT